MDRYLILSPHTKEDCMMALEHFAKFYGSYIHKFEWGCFDNDHNAYAIVEAESHESALMAVPPLFRNKARVTRLINITPELIQSAVHSTP